MLDRRSRRAVTDSNNHLSSEVFASANALPVELTAHIGYVGLSRPVISWVRSRNLSLGPLRTVTIWARTSISNQGALTTTTTSSVFELLLLSLQDFGLDQSQKPYGSEMAREPGYDPGYLVSETNVITSYTIPEYLSLLGRTRTCKLLQ